MIAFWVPVLLLLCMATALTLLFERTLVETFPVSVFLVILCLYLGGLLRNLTIGVLLVVLLAVGLWTQCFRKKLLVREQVKAHKQEWMRSAWVILPVLLLIFLQTWSLEMTVYDEYTHWGVAVKDLYLNNQFYCSPDAVTEFKDYMPGISLFEYFFCFFGPFQSQNIYRGMDVMMVACLFPAFKNVVKRNGRRIHILFGWLGMLILAYGNYAMLLRHLQVDAALAMLLCYFLLAWFGDEKKDGFTLLALSLGAMGLTMAKGSGIAIALMALVVIAADTLLQYRKAKKTIGIPATAAAVMAVTWLSWRVCTALYGVEATRSQGGGMLSGLLSILHGNIEEYQKTTIRNFYEAFIYGNVSDARNSITYYQWIFVLLIFALFVGLFAKNKKQAILLAVAMPAMHIIYSGMLLLAYVLSFGANEGPALASLFCYMPSCYLGCLLAMFGYLLIACNDGDAKTESSIYKRICAPILVVAIAGMALPVNYMIGDLMPLGPGNNTESHSVVAPYKCLRELAQNEQKDAEVYLLGDTGSSGIYNFQALISRYELMPLHCQVVELSDYADEEQLRQELLTADYLFVLPQDSPFTEQEQRILPDEISTEGGILYQVDDAQETFVPVT